MNTTEFLAIASAVVPGRTAIVFDGVRVTYEQLQERASRLANSLAGLGVERGDRVAILQVNSNECVETYFATAMLDAVYVPMNFRVRGEELAYMVNSSGAKVILVGSRYAEMVRECVADFDGIEHYVSLEERDEKWHFYEDLVTLGSPGERLPDDDDDDLTMILFTAGTTGSPKGVMLSHNSFSSYILDNVSPADPEIEERNILTVPLYHIAGMQALMAGVYGGRTLIVQRQFEAGQWMELVEQERANRAMMVPTMLKMLMDHNDFHRRDLSSLEVITYGAAPMPLEVIKRAINEFPGIRFINAFGQTETASTITVLPPEDHVLEGTPEEIETKLRRLSSIGLPLDDVEVRIVNEDGQPVGENEIGEIVAHGSRLMKGYWNMPEATSRTVRSGWLYTGDLGYFDSDGYIFLAGRSRDFIKRGGEMISPEEVEQVLHSHPAVDEAAIIGIPDIKWGECVKAIVVIKRDYSVSEEQLIEYCRQRLSSFKKPESVIFIPELPRNSLGKVLKRVLREEHGA